MIRQEHARGYLYGRDPSSPVSCSLPQLIPSIVANPRLYNDHHISERERQKGSRSLPELASQLPSPLLTATSNDSPWTYKPRSLGGLPTTPHNQRESNTANVSHGTGSSGICSLGVSSQRIDHRLIIFLGARFSTNIRSTGITSDECISEVQSLLGCSFKITLAMSIQGNEAQTFVDLLDQVSRLWVPCVRSLGYRPQALARSCLESKLQQRGLRLLSKICKAHGIVPSSYILRQELVRVGLVHYRSTFAVVSNGEYSGCPVAVKHLKINKGDTDTMFKVRSINFRTTVAQRQWFNQRLCREIIIWKHLSHANILPLLGVLISADLRCFRILTEWMPNGNVMRYTILNPKENRLRLVSFLVAFP